MQIPLNFSLQDALATMAVLVSLWTRAAVAELRAQVSERQEERCANCRKELATKAEVEALGKRVDFIADAT
jgi:hypothetical protein